MQSAYWRKVSARAFCETRVALRLETTERVLITCLVAIIGIGLIWLVDGGDQALVVFYGKCAATVAVLLMFPFIWIWKVVRAPALLDADLRQRIARKNDALEISERIGALWSEGEDLLSREGIESNSVEKVNWTVSVEKYLREVSLFGDAVGFSTLPTFNDKMHKLRRIWMRAAEDVRKAS